MWQNRARRRALNAFTCLSPGSVYWVVKDSSLPAEESISLVRRGETGSLLRNKASSPAPFNGPEWLPGKLPRVNVLSDSHFDFGEANKES